MAENLDLVPRACLTWPTLIQSTAKVLSENTNWYAMTEQGFLMAVLQASGGTIPPSRIIDLWNNMMEEAGLGEK